MDIGYSMLDSDDSSSSSSDNDDTQLSIMQTAALGLLDNHSIACQAIGISWNVLFDGGREFVNGDFSVNPLVPKVKRVERFLDGHVSIFKSMTGFTILEWEKLCQRVCTVILTYARHSGQVRKKWGRKTKLDPAERLLSFVLYTKHNTGARPQAIEWNCSRTSLNADGRFIASAINVGLSDEIQWPDAARRKELGRVLPEFLGCIGHVDGTLCRIRKLRIFRHKRYYNKRKEMYCMNNVIIVDHDGLIIYVDAGFSGSFHDVKCLKNSPIVNNWQQYFYREDLDHVQEYLLGDPGYLGLEMFILHRVDARELILQEEQAIVNAFNIRHAGRRVCVEWGIGGMKNRWQRLLDVCPTRRNNFKVVFEACALLTNFVHRQRMDFTMTDVGHMRRQDVHDSHFANAWGID